MNTNVTLGESNQTGIPYNQFETHRIAAPELLIMDRVITPIWYMIGIIGNPLSSKIWLSRKVRKTNSSAIYLGSIAIVHTTFIFLHIWMELLQAWGFRTYNRPVVCKIYTVLYMIPQYLAPILILGFTFERFLAVCFPFTKEMYCTVKRAMVVVGAFTTLSVAFSLCQAIVWHYDEMSDVCEIQPQRIHFYEVWTWFSEMLIFAAVPLAVLVSNILVIKEIKRINRFGNSVGHESSSNQTSTITLLSVSFYLICTLLPATIVYTIQLSIHPGNLSTPPKDWAKDSTWSSYLTYYHIRRIVEEICFSNYACYVFIYYITSSYFRAEVHKLWCCARSPGIKSIKTECTSNLPSYAIVGSGGKTCMEKRPTEL